METLKGEVHGHLIVGCSTTVGKYILPFMLASFMRKYPRVQASCFVKPRDVAVQMLMDGDVHLALASSKEFSKDTEFCKFISDPVILIVPQSHKWAQRDAIEPEELLEADFIMREEGSGTRSVVVQALQEFNLPPDQLNTVLTLGNSEAIALAVQEGIGVGFVSQIVVSRIVQDRVAPVKVNGLNMSQEIYVGRHTGQPATAAQNAFWEFMTDRENSVLGRFQAANAKGDWSEFPDWTTAKEKVSFKYPLTSN